MPTSAGSPTYYQGIHEYVAHLVSTLPTGLEGLKVVLDCAHGAAFACRAGRAARPPVPRWSRSTPSRTASTSTTAAAPRTSRALQKAVLEHSADAGFALDGDADRCLAVDRDGNVVDGDQILSILALTLRDRGRLAHDTVVATVMSNLGFLQAMERDGIRVEQTKVGDRYVLEAMKAAGYTLGGEQSGHVILSEHATTGDGTLTALHDHEPHGRRPARALAALAVGDDAAAAGARQRAGRRQGPRRQRSRARCGRAGRGGRAGRAGRVLLRPSGTEPLVRVMVEAESARHRAVGRRPAGHRREGPARPLSPAGNPPVASVPAVTQGGRMEIELIDVDDDVALKTWHDIYLTADSTERPFVTPWQYEEMVAMVRGDRETWERLSYVGSVDGVPVASAGAQLPLRDNLANAMFLVHMLPEHRRQGYATEMFARLLEDLAQRGRTVLQSQVDFAFDLGPDGTGEPGVEFLRAQGFSLALGDVMRSLDLPVDEAVLARLAEEAAPYHQDYRLVEYVGRCPDEHVESFARLQEIFLDEAPMGEMTVEREVYDEARIRTSEEVLASAQRVSYVVLALDPADEVVAFTQLIVPRHDPGRVFQWGTIVDPATAGTGSAPR